MGRALSWFKNSDAMVWGELGLYEGGCYTEEDGAEVEYFHLVTCFRILQKMCPLPSRSGRLILSELGLRFYGYERFPSVGTRAKRANGGCKVERKTDKVLYLRG